MHALKGTDGKIDSNLKVSKSKVARTKDRMERERDTLRSVRRYRS